MGARQREKEREGGCLHSEYWKWKPLRTEKIKRWSFGLGRGGGLRWEKGEPFVLIKFL
jgi:hypothetical protein